MSLRVGVCGLGIMGGAFAANLVKAGFQVTGFDPVKSKVNVLVKAGGKAGKSPADVARKSDVVITSLTSPAILDAVVNGKGGMASGAHKGMILIETSTLDIADKEEIRDTLAKKGATMVDCPVSGAGQQAASGQITTMASGTKKDFNAVREILEGFSMIQYYVGPFGNGMRLKLLINMLISVHGAAFAEAITLARGLTNPLDKAFVLADLASSQAAGGDGATGRATLGEAVDVAAKITDPWARARALSKAASALVAINGI